MIEFLRDPIITTFLIGIVTIVLIWFTLASFLRSTARERLVSQARVEQAEQKLREEPDEPTYAWDLARATLDSYFKRNLSQNASIYALSIIVLLAGFGVLLWGVSQAIQHPDQPLSAAIVTGAGVLTEFIGATFLLIYRSSVSQANEHSKILERINIVGMAVQILESIPDNLATEDIKNRTRSKMVELLITQMNAKEEKEKEEDKKKSES